MSARLTAATLCTVAVASFVAPAAAQTGSRTTTAVTAGATFETYRFGDSEAIGIESVTLITAPFGAAVSFNDRFGLSVRGAWARGSLSLASGDESTINGLTDTEIRASYTAGRDRVTFTAIALVPTGQDLLTAREIEVAGVVAADVLPFRITNWGTGGGFGGSVAFAAPLGDFGTGLSIGYVATRDWEPVETSPSWVYRPGNQLHVTAAIDRSVGPTGKLGLRASFLTYDADRVNDVNLYSAGNRIEATGSYAFAAGPRSSAIVWGGVHHRDEGALEDPSANTPVSPASDILFAGALLRMPLARGVLQPGLDFRAVSGDEAGTGFVMTAGLSAELPTGSVTLSPSAKARFGSIDPGDGSSSGLAGMELGVVVRFGGR